jgi:methylmalonyl-CoA mutase cobalamin-binding subunit
VQRKIVFTPTADQQLTAIENAPSTAAVCKQVKKTLGLIKTNLRHPSLNTHEFASIIGAGGEKVFEAYAQNNTTGAYRVFWHPRRRRRAALQNLRTQE